MSKKFKSETREIVSLTSQEAFSKWKHEIEYPKLIGLLSPFYEQYNIFKSLFPESKIIVFDINSWNLDHQKNFSFDLISASSVFMYSPNPEKWFSNVFSCCKYFWIHDLINRQRSEFSALGPDGDKVRFSFSPKHISDFEGAFDLRIFEERILDFIEFKVNASSHFLANLRGNLSDVDVHNLDLYSTYRNYLFKLKSQFRS